jgi:hypothetical protein
MKFSMPIEYPFGIFRLFYKNVVKMLYKCCINVILNVINDIDRYLLPFFGLNEYAVPLQYKQRFPLLFSTTIHIVKKQKRFPFSIFQFQF